MYGRVEYSDKNYALRNWPLFSQYREAFLEMLPCQCMADDDDDDDEPKKGGNKVKLCFFHVCIMQL